MAKMTEEEQEMISTYKMTHSRCAICHTRDHDAGFEVMHIYAGARRVHAECNILLGCCRCHRHQHNHGDRDADGKLLPVINTELLLRIKYDEDGMINAKELSEISCQPEAWIFGCSINTEIPEAFIKLRIENGSLNHNTGRTHRQAPDDAEG